MSYSTDVTWEIIESLSLIMIWVSMTQVSINFLSRFACLAQYARLARIFVRSSACDHIIFIKSVAQNLTKIVFIIFQHRYFLTIQAPELC